MDVGPVTALTKEERELLVAKIELCVRLQIVAEATMRAWEYDHEHGLGIVSDKVQTDAQDLYAETQQMWEEANAALGIGILTPAELRESRMR